MSFSRVEFLILAHVLVARQCLPCVGTCRRENQRTIQGTRFLYVEVWYTTCSVGVVPFIQGMQHGYCFFALKFTWFALSGILLTFRIVRLGLFESKNCDSLHKGL